MTTTSDFVHMYYSDILVKAWGMWPGDQAGQALQLSLSTWGSNRYVFSHRITTSAKWGAAQSSIFSIFFNMSWHLMSQLIPTHADAHHNFTWSVLSQRSTTASNTAWTYSFIGVPHRLIHKKCNEPEPFLSFFRVYSMLLACTLNKQQRLKLHELKMAHCISVYSCFYTNGQTNKSKW
jgi:hypothetical protein